MRALVVAALAVGCKEAPKQAPAPPPAPVPADATAAPVVDLAACEAAVAAADAAPPAARAKLLIDGCQVCGDWAAILRWNVPTAEGGPNRPDIEAAMERCNAFCIGDARMKFLGTLDDARGRSSRAPWKQLALLCKERVSAVPDDRFVDGVYFALDRIARGLGARAKDLEVSLPAVGVVGTGPPLPRVNGPTRAARMHVTVLGETLTVGLLPAAHLTADGLRVTHGDYPGTVVALPALAAAIRELGTRIGGSKGETVALIAPASAPATSLVPVIAGGRAPWSLTLAVRSPESPESWDVPVVVLPALKTAAKTQIRVTSKMTVQDLANQLVDLAGQGVTEVGITGS